MITQKEVRRLFSYNKHTGILKWKVKPSKNTNIGDVAGTINKGYIRIRVHNKKYYAHQIIWLGIYGYIPKIIDHKDKVKHHNWLSNLREINNRKNIINSNIRKDNTSGIKGIGFNKKEKAWVSRIRSNKKSYYIGSYKDFNEAVCARLAAEQCLGFDKWDIDSPAYRYVKENIIETSINKKKTKGEYRKC